jgi:hypothetical protein
MLRIDYLIALIALCAGMAGTIVSYRAIQQQEFELHAISPPIFEGEHQYLMLLGDNCLGTLRTQVELGPDQSVVKAEALLTLSSDGKPHTPSIAYEAFANSLDQVGGFTIILRHEGAQVLFAGQGTDPIRLTLRSNIPGYSFETKSSAPGPLLLRRNAAGSVRFHYSGIKRLLAQSAALSSHPSLQKLAFSISETRDARTQCAARTATTIDVQALHQLLPLLRGLQNLPSTI